MFRRMLLSVLLFPGCAWAAPTAAPTVLTSPMNVMVLLTALSFLVLFLVAATTFTRNIIVLSLTRQALGLQQTPPNIVLVALAFFLMLFVMSPVMERSYESGVKPYVENRITLQVAAPKAWEPFREFLIRQTREWDLALVYELAKEPLPKRAEDVAPTRLVPAFMLSELKIAFQIGFVIFLPFVIIDLVVASILMSLGMIMVPPITVSLPLKIMLFLLIDGWGLVAQALVRSVG
jgi:flagellar biosynthetic protein FliP